MATVENTETSNIRERLTALRRHQGYISVIFAVAATLTVLLAFLWPPTYQSSGTILIEQQEIPQEMVRSTITSFADQRVQVISQRVMTSQNLMQIIDRYDLYPQIRKSKPREVVLKKMRDDVHMAMISADVIDPRSGRPTRANIAFSVSYDNRTPDLAYKVANELTSLYLNENSTSRAKQSEQAASFLKEEAEKLSASIAAVDAKISEFKGKHHDSLPELSALNLNGTERTDMELRDVNNRISTLNQQLLIMQAQLAALNPTASLFADTGQRIMSPGERLKAARSQLAGALARYSPDHPEVLAAQREIAGLEAQVDSDSDVNDIARQLESTKGQLAAARERYSSDHPDVKRLERQVASLQQAAASAPAVAHAKTARPDNPAYIQVKGQLEALSAERDTLMKKQGDLQAKLGNYESRLAAAPEVEREYRGLMRDSESLRVKYGEVRAKQTEAEVSQNLETERKGERFTLIEPPLPPEQPVSPKRMFVLISGLLLSLGLALGLGWLREANTGSVRGPNDLRRLLKVPPLAMVPQIVTMGERLNKRIWRKRLLTWSLAGTVAVLVLFHFFVMPLDILWAVISRRFGA